MFASLQSPACALFRSAFIYKSRPLEQTTAPTYFHLKTRHPDVTSTHLLLVCHFWPFLRTRAWLEHSVSLASFRRCRQIKRCAFERLLHVCRLFCSCRCVGNKMLCDLLSATHLQLWPGSTLSPSSCWHICDSTSTKAGAEHRERWGWSRLHLPQKREEIFSNGAAASSPEENCLITVHLWKRHPSSLTFLTVTSRGFCRRWRRWVCGCLLFCHGLFLPGVLTHRLSLATPPSVLARSAYQQFIFQYLSHQMTTTCPQIHRWLLKMNRENVVYTRRHRHW